MEGKGGLILLIAAMLFWLNGCAVSGAPKSPGVEPCTLPAGVSPYSLEALAYEQHCASIGAQQQ